LVLLDPPIHVSLIEIDPLVGENPNIDITVRAVIAANPAAE